MPKDTGFPGRRTIAVIGGGISGMSAAYLLSDRHNVTLYEAEPRLGGHARTVVAGKRGDQPVDTGFIVFNHPNYPLLTSLFHKLGVPVAPSDMSFGASIGGGRIEYSLGSTRGIFAQPRNLLRPGFYRMIRDILKFNAQADEIDKSPDMTVGQLIETLQLGRWFREYYLTPLSGAIWSTPIEKILDFPADAMIRFFRNHALMQRRGHQWYTVEGGSARYVSRIWSAMTQKGVDLRLAAPIAAVKRLPAGVMVRAKGGIWERFDEIVFATHSDDTLRLLSDVTPAEQGALSKVRYQPNDVVLHCDPAMMPKRKAVWSSWNYTEQQGKIGDAIDLTYWMNRLQPIPMDDQLYVTLNATQSIREEMIYDQVTLRHPVFDVQAMEGQRLAATLNGTNRTWFCGAWMKNGFHEDGLSSAVDVVDAIFAGDAIKVAAQ